MRLHRFYIPQEIGAQTELTVNSKELAHQIHGVFRLKKGDPVIVFDGSGFDYECHIDGYEKGNTMRNDSAIRFTVVSSQRSRYSPPRRLYACAAIVKKDTFEWIVEKATELGVTDIIPLSAERSEKKSLNGERLRKISIEASEQSGRSATPMVHAIMGPADAAAFLKKENEDIQMVAFHTEGEHLDRSSLSGEGPLAVFIGPEGGWSDDEIDMFHKNDIDVVCLGTQVLRAETAVIAALSQAVFD